MGDSFPQGRGPLEVNSLRSPTMQPKHKALSCAVGALLLMAACLHTQSETQSVVREDAHKTAAEIAAADEEAARLTKNLKPSSYDQLYPGTTELIELPDGMTTDDPIVAAISRSNDLNAEYESDGFGEITDSDASLAFEETPSQDDDEDEDADEEDMVAMAESKAAKVLGRSPWAPRGQSGLSKVLKEHKAAEQRVRLKEDDLDGKTVLGAVGVSTGAQEAPLNKELLNEELVQVGDEDKASSGEWEPRVDPSLAKALAKANAQEDAHREQQDDLGGSDILSAPADHASPATPDDPKDALSKEMFDVGSTSFGADDDYPTGDEDFSI